MSVALPEFHPLAVINVDPALSPEAAGVRDALGRVAPETGAEMLGSARRSALTHLREAFRSGSADNWDGEGASSVEFTAYEYAHRLIELLPVDLPVPEIYPEPDGDLAIEWDLGKRRVLSIAVGRDGTLNYAGLFGRKKLHGVEFLGDRIPPSIWIALSELVSSGR